MNFIDQSLIQKIVQALCWTLIHSLWQGLILAILAGVLLISTKSARPVLRYNVLALLLFLFVPVSVFTFWTELGMQITPRGMLEVTGSTQSFRAGNAPLLYHFPSGLGSKAFIISKLTEFFNANSTFIVVLWFIVFSIKSLKTASGLAFIYKIRSKRVHEVEDPWRWRLRQLAERIGMYKRVGLVMSEIVTVPMVAGFLRPVIIVPIGFLTNLPATQVEAILLHELAHIRRSDYLVNLLQSFGETLFFFNPAILWISSLIREEREHCCDDIAIAALEDKSSFINALVSFQEYNLSYSSQAVAFAGKRNHLLDRIKRIIYNNNKQLNAMEKLFVTVSIIAAAGLSVAFSHSEKKEIRLKLAPKSVAESPKPVQILPAIKSDQIVAIEKVVPVVQSADTLPKKKGYYENHRNNGISNAQFNRDGKEYLIVQDGDEIVYLKVDGKKIAKEDMGQYKTIIDDMQKEMKEAQRQAEIARGQAEQQRKQADELRKQADILRDQADGQRKQADEMRMLAEKDRKNADEIRNSHEKQRGEVEQVRKQADEIRAQAEGIRKQADAMRLDAEGHRKEAEKFRAEAEVMRQKAEVSRKEADVMRAKYEKMQEELIGDLIKEGVIKNRDGLSYKLSKDELVVNGKKQSDSLHQKFKAKFVKDENVEMVYNWSGRTGYTSTGLIYTR